MRTAIAVCFLALAAVAQTTVRDQTVSVFIPHLAAKADERVVSFQIKLTAGAVQSVSDLPVGWYVVVDNDASWRTSVKGNTTVGAAALSADDFQKIRLIVRKNETDVKFSVSGAVSLTRDFEKERSVSLKMLDFVVTSIE